MNGELELRPGITVVTLCPMSTKERLNLTVRRDFKEILTQAFIQQWGRQLEPLIAEFASLYKGFPSAD
jgi:hypothetical protein